MLENGYELEYERLCQGICRDERKLSSSDCIEVGNILDMFCALKRSYGDLAGQGTVEERDVEFLGFDGNLEGKQLRYACYLLRQQGRFTELKEGGKNSHFPVLDAYRRMLKEWDASQRRHTLTEADMKRISSARFSHSRN